MNRIERWLTKRALIKLLKSKDQPWCYSWMRYATELQENRSAPQHDDCKDKQTER